MLHTRIKEDTYKHKGWRKALVEELKGKGITDPRVLEAINAIPRHFFLDTAFEHRAYEDKAFPISAGQTISQPYTVAFQTQLLELKKYDKVLEIGTGSGYQSMVLAEMGHKVFTIERQKELYDELGHFFLLKKYPGIKRHYGDGYKGIPGYAPFHKILITAAAPFIPPALIDQLKPGGFLVLPLGDEKGQIMMRITKDEAGNTTEDHFGKFDFVPMLEGRNGN